VAAAPAGAASTRSAGPSIGAARAYVPTVGAHRSRLVVDISVRYHDARNLAAPAPRGEAISRRSATRRVVARPAQAAAPIAANGSFSLGRDPNGNPFVSGTFGPGPFGGTQVQVAWQSPIGQQACEVLAGNDRSPASTAHSRAPSPTRAGRTVSEELTIVGRRPGMNLAQNNADTQ
jgi:hypothetical protein